MNRSVPLLGNNGSCAGYYRFYCCAGTLRIEFFNSLSQFRTLALPEGIEHWSLTTLYEKLVKIGAKVLRHGRYITFQMAEVAIPRTLFVEILRLIDGLRPEPLPP